ncbi:MAG: hypothetical protein LBH25_07645 [Fibromonadaceae bacterium]|jgi:hypothetical protein|nr:hypothetical protein [Fibromonadaceae bacterium]
MSKDNRGKMFPALVAVVACLLACSSYDREEFRMETGKKYYLKKWPDSVFIDTLDRYFTNEPIKQSQKKKAEISMSMNNKTMSLPGISTNTPPKKTQSTSTVPNKSEEGSQSFPEKFFEALDKLAENPGSKEFGKKHKARNGETLDAMLLRIYGSQVKKVPKYLSEDMLKKLNPSIDFTSLSEGDMVLLPVVK